VNEKLHCDLTFDLLNQMYNKTLTDLPEVTSMSIIQTQL